MLIVNNSIPRLGTCPSPKSHATHFPELDTNLPEEQGRYLPDSFDLQWVEHCYLGPNRPTRPCWHDPTVVLAGHGCRCHWRCAGVLECS